MTTERKDSAARLDEALGRLPQGIEPARDLWPAVEARLEPRTERTDRPPRRWLWPAAAAVLLVVGSSLITANLLRRDEPAVATAPPAQANATYAAAFGPGQTLDPTYYAARQELVRTLSARIERLSPETRQQLEKNLAEMRRASAEINVALELSPGDPLLEELLLNAYQDELAVLASVNQLTGNGAGATTDPTRMQL